MTQTKQYEPCGCEVQTLRIKDMWIQCEPGNNAEELLDKIQAVIEQFAIDGNWTFNWYIES